MPLTWLYRHLRKRMEWVSGWLDGYTAMPTGAPAVLTNLMAQNQNKRSQSFWPNVEHRGEAELASAKGLVYQQTNSRNCAQKWSGFPTKLASVGIWSGRAARQEGIPRQPAAQSDLLQSSPLASRQPMVGPLRGKEIVMDVVKSCKLENRWTNKVIDGWRAKWQRRSCLIDDSWETGGSGAPLAPGAS